MSRTTQILGLLVLAAVGLAAGGASDSVPESFRFTKAAVEELPARPVPKISLTASDGTGLALVALEANGVLEPPLAFTELRLTFENPRDEVMEGRFRIALPPGAAISRFAMKIGGSWQEGEVVERQRARQVYEDFLHRRQDPALLEQEAGNEFSARVFPIPARARKELIVSYSHALARADEPYVIPLLGLAEIDQLDIRVFLGDRPATPENAAAVSNLGGEVRERRVVELHKRNWAPDRDFEIGQDRVADRSGLRHENLAVVRVAAPAAALPQVPQEIKGLFVLFDSSASRALGYEAQVHRLAELAAGLRDGAGAAAPLGVAAFDQEAALIFEGTAGGFGADEVSRLRSRKPLGASDLQGALAWLGDRLARSKGKYPRVLLVTDGVATAGDTEARALKAAVRALGQSGVERLDVLAVGGLRDEAALRELTTGNLAHDGQRIDGGAPLADIARRLTHATRSGIKIAVEGASWVWPETLDGVQPGDEVLVYADLPAGRPLRLTLDGRTVPQDKLAAAEKPLLERAWVQARIERLLHLREAAFAGDEDLRRALGREVAELSVQHRVLSPFTALLVLETEYDYERFGLDRRALADILTVGAGGVEVLARARYTPPPVTAVAAAPKAVAPPDSDAFDELREAPEEVLDIESGEPEGVVGGVVGGVEGGVAGGMVGGVPGGVAAPVQPIEVAETVLEPVPQAADAPLRIGVRPPVQGDAIAAAPRVEEKTRGVEPYEGRFAEVMSRLAAGKIGVARGLAETWWSMAPGDVLALLALGETWEAAGEKEMAARAYGSLIDLFPGRADLRRLAGERLERLGEPGLALAIDTYQKAVVDRPDHPSGHRLLAWALLRAGRPEEAFAALEAGLGRQYPGGRFAGVDRVLREDLGLIAAAWLRAEPSRRSEALERLRARGAEIESEPSLRFVITWETDANDVDLHVYDRLGGHAYYGAKELASGGDLYADVTTGYGPECFVVREPDRKAAPYRLKAHYYNRGPMGYGMGIVQVVSHDGEGGLSVEPRPFVVMADDALIDIGAVGAMGAVGAVGKGGSS